MGIAWRESLAIGITEIDNQHKELLGRFDRLLKACETGQGTSELQKLMSFLNDYVVEHFADEESLQRLKFYPGYEAHRKEHQAFVERVRNLQGEIERDGVAVHHVMETNNLLLKWLIHHISSSDVELGTYLKKADL